MSERNRKGTNAKGVGGAGEAGGSAAEERLRALFDAAHPWEEAPERLRHRVVGMVAQHEAQGCRRNGPWLLCFMRQAPATLAMTGAISLLILGLSLAAWHHDRAMGPRRQRIAQPSRPDRAEPRLPHLARPLGQGTGRLAARPALPLRESSLAAPATVAQTSVRKRHAASDARRTRSHPNRDWDTLEAHVRQTVPLGDDFVQVPFQRLASTADQQVVAAVEAYKREAAVLDPRLSREVALRLKATALTDLCERLRSDTGIQLTAGQSVADEKVTLFCKKMPLRDVMRQLSRPFGYTWLRSPLPAPSSQLPAKAGSTSAGSREPGAGSLYRYELVQDLRSQLLEEELRNRDRNEALLALDREMERFRPYLGLTPDEALARSKTAPPAEKRLLEKLAGYGWGAIQMYFRLSAQDMAGMRAGQGRGFSDRPGPNDRPLPADLKRGVLQSFRDWTVVKYGDGYRMAFEVANPETAPIPAPALPGTHAWVSLSIDQRELGRTTLHGQVGWGVDNSQGQHSAGGSTGEECATGISPTVLEPGNAAMNAKLARDPALRSRVSARPRPSCALPPDPNAASPGPPEPRVTSADVLEALHQATGLPIVSDYYTRLYKPEEVSAPNQALFDALNHLADATRMRWRWDGGWLQFRSTSYYDDRRKEVPNRLLIHWAAARRQQGLLNLDDLVEIAQLPDAPLDAREMAEGARASFGLMEWDLASNPRLRSHLRFLAGFTPAQRQEAMAPSGLAFTRMPLAQQQRFLTLALGSDGEGLQALEELAGAALRVEYTQPGSFQWGQAGHPGQGNYTRWVIPLEPGPQGQRVLRPVVQEKTREAALQAVRRVQPRLREALLEAVRRADPRLEPSLYMVEEEQIFPTRLDLCFLYMPGATNARGIQLQTSFASYGIRPQ